MAEPQKKWSFSKAFAGIFSRSEPITDDTWDELEVALIGADFGLDITEELLSELRDSVIRYGINDVRQLRELLRDTVTEKLACFDSTLRLTEKPAIVLVVGVNGVGKTTTIGKFARYLRNFDKRVLIGAADTFRAAAVEQLATWADRAGADIVTPRSSGQDPASVAYETVSKALSENYDVVLIDTAGRLQTKNGLMDELSKIKRVIEKLAPISEVLLVLDATTGQNGLSQAESFIAHAGVSGIVLTKLDGSAKGGFVLSVQRTTDLPLKLVGQGEGIGDFTGFTSHVFAQQLVG
ncbi:signal recognition particle-docking protein FtsY [Canibacter sp. lx-45]|uniref:signal recognition particle-docking protein FtsY n=1 Tax=Canibacter zhuwentaonis TaxID=2837491 RepID=UPI001BDC889D|nr:signal recognition particle-docking protein FtsY [Canibacter zhuwentaonis]MBT1034906.1 signal recognition particle-docking protein FtsY [Canibacter zhuwentaonis]